MTKSWFGAYRSATWLQVALLLIAIVTIDGQILVRAAGVGERQMEDINILNLVEQVQSEINELVHQKKLPEERLSEAASLKRSYAKRQIELNARIEILKIDALADTVNKDELIEELIETVRVKEQTLYEYIVRLQILRNPSAKFDQESVMYLPKNKPDQLGKDRGRKSGFSIKWEPDTVISGEHD